MNYCKLIDKIEEDQVSGHDLVKCARGVEWMKRMTLCIPMMSAIEERCI